MKKKSKTWLAGYRHGRELAARILAADLDDYNPGSTIAGGLSFRQRSVPQNKQERSDWLHAIAEGMLDELADMGC